MTDYKHTVLLKKSSQKQNSFSSVLKLISQIHILKQIKKPTE